MLHSEKINSRLLFIISFSITVLAIYFFKFNSSGSVLYVPHNVIQNVLFINITFLGSTIFCFGLIIYLFYKKKNKMAWLITASTFLSVLVIQIIKNYLNKGGIQIFFEEEQYLFNTAEKTTAGLISSHIALAFVLATVLALYFNNKLKTVFLFFIAVVVLYSRIYLGHHTLPELLAGAFTGLASGSLSFYCYLNYTKLKKSEFFKQKKYNNTIPINNFSIE